jgi:O-antigen/teichoic acid export membrane protein
LGENPAAQSDDRARNITRGISSLSIQNLGTSVLAFVLLFALIRFFPDEFGIYSAVLLVVGIAGAFSSFGLQAASTRYVAFLRDKDEAESWAAAKSTLILTLILSVIVTLAYCLLSPYLSLFFTKSTQSTLVFLLGGLWLFVSSISSVVQGIIQGMKKYVLLAKMLFISRFVMVAFTIVVLLAYRDIVIPVLGWAIFYILIMVWSLKIVRKDLFSKKIGRYSFSTIMRYSFPLGIAGIIQVFASSSDSIVVGGYLSSVPLGIYTAAIQLTGVLSTVLMTPLTTAFFPETSSAADSELSNAFRLAIRFLMLSVLPASFMLAALSPQLITLFSGGINYSSGILPMESISIFYVFTGIQGVALYLLQSLGRTMHAMITVATGAIVDIGASIILVHYLGLEGAAISKISTALIGTLVAVYLVRAYARNLDRVGFYFKCLVSAAIPFAASLLLTSFVSSRTLTLIPYTLLSAFLFIVCLKFMKVLSEEDRRYISHLLPSFGQKILKLV